MLTGDADIDAILGQCIDVLEAKGHDYTIGSSDRLHNFRTAAAFMGTTTEKVLGVYWYKHVSAIFAFIQHGHVESEPVEGRIVDAINYLLLLGKMVAERKRAAPPPA